MVSLLDQSVIIVIARHKSTSQSNFLPQSFDQCLNTSSPIYQTCHPRLSHIASLYFDLVLKKKIEIALIFQKLVIVLAAVRDF